MAYPLLLLDIHAKHRLEHQRAVLRALQEILVLQQRSLQATATQTSTDEENEGNSECRMAVLDTDKLYKGRLGVPALGRLRCRSVP
jgi:hypothetical protein